MANNITPFYYQLLSTWLRFWIIR